MSWLTRIRVDAKTALNTKLWDSYAWHQALWHCFPGNNGQQRKFLNHVNEQGTMTEVLLLSPSKPEIQSWGCWETKEIPPDFLQHGYYQFGLRANPTIKKVVVVDGKHTNGRRVGIYDEVELLAWLKRKGEAAGFEVVRVQVSPPVDQHSQKSRRRFTHSRVDFDGILVVKDTNLFSQAYVAGIGSAKAFGFGLLRLRPLAQ